MHYSICQHGNYLKSKMSAPITEIILTLTKAIAKTRSKILVFGAAIGFEKVAVVICVNMRRKMICTVQVS